MAGEIGRVECVPLCAASRVYRNPQWWQHEALCPVRINFLRERAEQAAEAAEHDDAIIGGQLEGGE